MCSFYLFLALGDLGLGELKDFAEDTEGHLGSIFRTKNQFYHQLLNELLISFILILLCFRFCDRLDIPLVLVPTKLDKIYISLSSFLSESTS